MFPIIFFAVERLRVFYENWTDIFSRWKDAVLAPDGKEELTYIFFYYLDATTEEKEEIATIERIIKRKLERH